MTAFITFGQSLIAIDKVIAFDIDKLYDKDIKHECYCIVAEMINGNTTCMANTRVLSRRRKV